MRNRCRNYALVIERYTHVYVVLFSFRIRTRQIPILVVRVLTHFYVSEAVLSPQFRMLREPGRPQALVVIAKVETSANEYAIWRFCAGVPD